MIEVTYEVRSGDHRDHYVTLSKAVTAHARNVTSRLPSTLYGPETLGSDGIMSRDVIASYEPPEPPKDRHPRSSPPGGSPRAYYYALGHVDGMDGLAWFTEDDAAQFSVQCVRSPASTLKDEWSQYLRQNEPREE